MTKSGNERGEKPPHKNEGIKSGSDYLRGTLVESLNDPLRGDVSAEDAQLTKFHGIYLQDDRDERRERRKRKLDKAYSARFSADDFGLVVRCQARDVPEIDGLMREHRATEVTLVES